MRGGTQKETDFSMRKVDNSSSAGLVFNIPIYSHIERMLSSTRSFPYVISQIPTSRHILQVQGSADG